MNVGDYVRTKYGITQFKEYESTNGSKLLCMPVKDGSNGIFANIEDVIKSSPNIIDLIQVGDYVNGREVREVYDLGFGKCFCFKNEYGRHYDKTYKIKSILTKEQFESIEYKVGDKENE